MRKAIVILGTAVFGLVALGAEEGGLLLALDRARFLDLPVGQLTVLVRSEEDGKVEEAELLLAFREIGGADYVRIEFLRPADLAGQVFLVTPDGTFFWGPELFAPLRTSGAQVGFGDAPVGQLSGIRFADDYRIVSQREEGGATVLELQALSPAVPFQAVVVVVDPATELPRELRLLAPTGILLYRVLLTEYARFDGDLYVREQVVENALVEGSRTTLTIVGIRVAPLPEEAFDPGRLGR